MERSHRISRRVVLASAGSVLPAALAAGCLSTDGDRRFRIQQLELWNRTDSTQRVGVRVTADGETVAERTRELAGGGSFLVADELPDDRRAFAVSTRFGDGDWRTVTTPGDVNADCLRLTCMVEPGDGTNEDALSTFVAGCDETTGE